MAEVASHSGHLGIDVFAGGDLPFVEDISDRSVASDAAHGLLAQARFHFDSGKNLPEVLSLKYGVGE
jgi:hypothetical protein